MKLVTTLGESLVLFTLEEKGSLPLDVSPKLGNFWKEV